MHEGTALELIETTMEKETMSAEQAKEFVKNNLYKINPEHILARCVDGRYSGADNLPALAKPGGDAGDVMIVYAALKKLQVALPKQEVLQLVLDTVDGLDKFQFHSDHHADPAVPGMGCGHLKQAKQDPEMYGVEPEEMHAIFEELPELLKQGAHQIVLDGDHGEQAVLVVQSDTYSVKPMDDTGRQAFVYHKTLDELRLEKLAKNLCEHLQKSYLDMKQEAVDQAVNDAAVMQLHETVKRLAEGLPTYVVDITIDGVISVNG